VWEHEISRRPTRKSLSEVWIQKRSAFFDKGETMQKRITILATMIGWDFSLHLVEILGKVDWHPLYPWFPLWNAISYDLFWTTYWGIAFLITLSLLWRNNENKKR